MTTPTEFFLKAVLRCATIAAGMLAVPALALPFTFSTGGVTDVMASATRPDTGGVFEIESADDFVLGSATQISSATFTGLLLPSGAVTPTIGEIVVEIYRVFRNDSDAARRDRRRSARRRF